MAPPMPPAASGPDVVAAGAVVSRKGPKGREVLLVHRPKYDDWSFPKGKQDPGEHVTATAVREVLEESGVEIRLGRPLRPQLYVVNGGRAKKVHYWTGHVVGDDDLTAYRPNEEVDDLGWFTAARARERLTYLDDLDLLAQHEEQKRTTPLIVIRHARSMKRSSWKRPDPERPLTRAGKAQSQELGPLLHAYGVSRLVSSTSIRCTDTLAPYARDQVVALQECEALSEEGFDPPAVAALLAELLATREATAVCSHRPVLPELFELLGLEEEPLGKAELVVCHHRKGRVVAAERHLVR